MTSYESKDQECHKEATKSATPNIAKEAVLLESTPLPKDTPIVKGILQFFPTCWPNFLK